MAPAADDSAYQDNPYGVSDPTAMFQQFSTQNQQNRDTGAMNQAALQGGMNPTQAHAQAVQQQMQRILSTVQPGDNEDPLDYQMRQAKEIRQGMLQTDPNIAMRADQQMIRLENAKSQQAHLQSETELQSAQAKKINLDTATNPMVLVKQGVDENKLPTYTTVGSPVNVADEKGNIRTGWSNDIADQQKANPDATPMRQSDYLALIEKMNEGRNIATLYKSQQQLSLQMMSRMSPDAIAMRANQFVNRDADMATLRAMQTSRNPVLEANANDIVDYITNTLHTDPASIDESDFRNNTKTYAAFNTGQQGDQVRGFNVALTHAQLLRQYAANMRPDGTLAPDSPFFNYFRTAWQKVEGSPLPTNFDAAKNFVADEWANAIVKGRGSALTDREQAQKELTRNASQEQISGALDGWMSLGGGQLGGLKGQFKSSLQGVPDDKVEARWNQKLSDSARTEYASSKGGTEPIHTPVQGPTKTPEFATEADVPANFKGRAIIGGKPATVD